MGPFRIHVRLSTAIRDASRLREELNADRSSMWKRMAYRCQYLYLSFQIRWLTEQLRPQ